MINIFKKSAYDKSMNVDVHIIIAVVEALEFNSQNYIIITISIKTSLLCACFWTTNRY